MRRRIFEDSKISGPDRGQHFDIEALAKVREKLVMLIKERTGEDCFVYEGGERTLSGAVPVWKGYGEDPVYRSL